MIVAHRGASAHAHENSLEAVRLAAKLGADGVEIDVHSTRDGVMVVHHDPILPGLGWIRDLTEQAVRSVVLPNGEPLPTLAEALSAAPSLDMWIEVKWLSEDQDGHLLRTIDADPGPERCAIHSFDHRLIRRLSQSRPGLRLGALSTAYLLNPVEVLRATGATTLWQEWQLIDDALVETIHAAGGQVIAWTVNDADHARTLAALGVDGLCGNFPERLRVPV